MCVDRLLECLHRYVMVMALTDIGVNACPRIAMPDCRRCHTAVPVSFDIFERVDLVARFAVTSSTSDRLRALDDGAWRY